MSEPEPHLPVPLLLVLVALAVVIYQPIHAVKTAVNVWRNR